MKRILIPAGGAILATGMLAAGLAGTASADTDIAKDNMATSAANAKAIAQFWADNNGAALKAATESNVWDKADVAKLQSKGGSSSDTKPGSTAPIGEEKKTTAKVQNVNMPKTIGKVFFVNAKGEKKWCSGTSIQSKYRNLVSTAGHCVYDTGANADVMSKWVFVPGYYQGRAPWGVYVGKQAFT
ncbi:trypsin-like serine peptidase, partial [Nonomuraea sp. NPDC004297]